MARGALDPIPPVAERNLIQVGLEDLVFAVMLLHLPGGCLLIELSANAAISAVDQSGMHVADELLGNGARAATLAEDVVLERARYTDDVDAVVLVEAVVLDRDEGVGQVIRQRLDRDIGSDLLANLTD